VNVLIHHEKFFCDENKFHLQKKPNKKGVKKTDNKSKRPAMAVFKCNETCDSGGRGYQSSCAVCVQGSGGQVYFKVRHNLPLSFVDITDFSPIIPPL